MSVNQKQNKIMITILCLGIYLQTEKKTHIVRPIYIHCSAKNLKSVNSH